MIVDSVADLAAPPIFMRLNGLLPHCPVYLKIEGLNVAGSIKLKTARQLVEDLERAGKLRPGCRVIESSSGNLGLAMAIVCLAKKYHFICVTDPNALPQTRRMIASFGAEVVVIEKRDPAGGYLQSRLDFIQRALAADPQLVWTNQYASPSNARAHYKTTAPEILQYFPQPHWVFLGAGTTGTSMGCGAYLREHAPKTRVVAVDSIGSVTFGGKAGARYLPGIGTSRRPELADESLVDQVTMVAEADAVTMCREVLRTHGLLLGASTGSVLAAIVANAGAIRAGDTVVAVSADLGDRYLDTLYDDSWIAARFQALHLPRERQSGASETDGDVAWAALPERMM